MNPPGTVHSEPRLYREDRGGFCRTERETRPALTVLDLFSGIGGFSLGLERAGMRTVAFCEIDPYCRAVLRKHWRHVPCHDDITTMQFEEGQADVICGGFPCQDISNAGRGAGLAGSRSGLWREMVRAIRMVRPIYVIVENVAALLNRGMGRVLGDLAENGYDAQWDSVSARSVGAPHHRERILVIAHAASFGQSRSRAYCNEIYPTPHAFREADRLVHAFRTGALPFVCGRHDGPSPELDEARLTALGNVGVPPQVIEQIGRAIISAHGSAS